MYLKEVSLRRDYTSYIRIAFFILGTWFFIKNNNFFGSSAENQWLVLNDSELLKEANNGFLLEKRLNSKTQNQNSPSCTLAIVF